MKKIQDIKPRILLAMALIPLALVIAAVPENTTKPYKLTIEELISEITDGAQYFTTDQIAEYIVQKDPSIQLIDVRSKDEFDTYHLPGAINIPLVDIISDEWLDILDQDVRTNVFYSTGTVNANQAWLICTQRGFKNNYVMQGGLNYWAETILNPQTPATTAPDDEFARYDFRKAMNSALGGGTLEAASSEPVAASPGLPAIQKKPKKKKASGGC
jgi:rhodanese-related sulfurtransferase